MVPSSWPEGDGQGADEEGLGFEPKSLANTEEDALSSVAREAWLTFIESDGPLAFEIPSSRT
jgi:hypothetical protein